MEQPTLFYAISVILAISEATTTDVRLARGYVGLLVAHSLWQALINTVPVRFTLFLASTALLAVLAVRALIVTLLIQYCSAGGTAMTGMEILKPVVALAIWTMVMWLWMYGTRIPAISALPKSDDPKADVGWTGAKLEGLLKPNIQWKAHNYNHLHEAPTVFYAVALVLALIHQGNGINLTIAWVYVGLRVVHSIFQSTVNKVAPRFALFALSSLALIMLVTHAAIAVFSL